MNGGPLLAFFAKNKSEKVTLRPKTCQKWFLVSGGFGTLYRLMELDVLINALNMQPYFIYSIQLSVSVAMPVSVSQ